MNFDQSTQAKCWMFDRESLMRCKQQAAIFDATGRTSGPMRSKPSTRNFACGFQQHSDDSSETRPLHAFVGSSLSKGMATGDQEILVHFHSHQIQRLVGPNAIFPELRRSASVLSTAIMLFRRFYLSNSVIDFHPRNIAAASALLSAKVECERSLEIDILSHATSIVNLKAHKASLCREELRYVTVEEIEEAERNLLDGLDFRLRCHHPYGAIRVLAGEIASCTTEHATKAAFFHDQHFESPRGINDIYSDERLDSLGDRALAVAQAALVYSDVNFLYPPGKIAFAAVAIALEGKARAGCLGPRMRNYLRTRFPQKNVEELFAFERDVVDIMYEIEACPEIDLMKFSSPSHRRFSCRAKHQASEIRRVFTVAAYYRGMMVPQHTTSYRVANQAHARKRSREETYHPCSYGVPYKAARVTPTQTPFF